MNVFHFIQKKNTSPFNSVDRGFLKLL